MQPALACGYRFEDEALVEEMISEVSKERGALPLLAFAASRLWEKRDRERGLLTREAYREIGGVAGALAQHAEDDARADRDAAEPPRARDVPQPRDGAGDAGRPRARRAALGVRQGRRAQAAEEVLRALVDARLLTSYETARWRSSTSRC